ncbi:SH3 domain-containing protein [Dysgonomonas sp. 25]|uniref:SH3 domain-containing protein n=1 Tax=Dysgonomonas sp. 25 TaxID=2302933 RepID=UPI0013D21451|nr:SH3 domain-containing protein [Dysgonomonas sp. 25]NDV69172.1 tetratricopeptide repeat protein [Dysgonomonas sp. 25]
MKRIILSLFIILCTGAVYAQEVQPADSLAQAAPVVTEYASELQRKFIEAYNAGEYPKAIALLEKEKEEQLAKGMESADLYYNLGNAYFRDNEVAKAILYYERALLLKPGDKDIQHNILYANTRIEDKIAKAGTFFLSEWMKSLQETNSSDGWAVFAGVCFILLVGVLFLFFFSRKIAFKQLSFYLGILLVVLVIVGNVFAYRQKVDIQQRDYAIVMSPTATVRSSPDKNSNQVFTLHSGTKVKITKDDRDWCEIEIISGNVGWIEKSRIEVI